MIDKRGWAFLSFLIYLFLSPASANQPLASKGQAVYEYYCYQCHGYAGNGQTLASVYISPKPRDFTSRRAKILSEQQMLDAVNNGRAGTAMVAFSEVLSPDEVQSVVDYLRTVFTQNQGAEYKYHSVKNGWSNHEKYRLAFPFVAGELLVNSIELTPAQILGKDLYLNACISCHDQPLSNVNEEVIWQKGTQDSTSVRIEK